MLIISLGHCRKKTRIQDTQPPSPQIPLLAIYHHISTPAENGKYGVAQACPDKRVHLGNTRTLPPKVYALGIGETYLSYCTFLPEAFYHSTFETENGCPQRSLEVEGDLAMALDHKIEDAAEEGPEDEEDDQ